MNKEEFSKKFDGYQWHFHYYDQEYGDQIHTISSGEVWCDLDSLLRKGELNDISSLTVEEICDLLSSPSYDNVTFSTKEMRQENKRACLETRASLFAREAGIERCDSFAFIQALERSIAAEGNFRSGLEEDRLCAGYGITPEQYYEEMNYSRSKASELREMLDWLEESCPLLMAQYREKQLREKEVDSED